MLRRTSDNKPVYCLQAHVLVTNGAGLVGFDDDVSQSTLLNVSFEDRIRIFQIAYFGYGYGNHSSLDWYAVTQIMIWQVTDRNDNPPYPVADGDRTLTYSNRYDAMMDEINYLVDHANQTVSFDNQTVTANIGDTITLTDTNGLLSEFFDVSSSDVNVTKSGNTLYIKSNKIYNGTITLTPRIGNKPVIYDGANQKVLSAGDPYTIQANLNVRFVGGDVEGYKKDFDTNLSIPQGEAKLGGAIYDIYDSETNQVVATVTTDENGHFKSGELPEIKKYYLKERKPSEGYLLDETKYYFDIKSGNLHPKIDVYEKVITRDFEYTKVFASDKTGIMTPEPNIEFGIYNFKNELYKKLISDEEGKIYVTLPYGRYTLKQLSATIDHEKLKDYNFEVKDVGAIVNKVFANADITAKLKVIKIDKDSGNVIARSNIKFKIFNVDTGEYVKQTITYPKVQTIEIFETDDNGILITPYPLASGNYKLEEVDQVIDGYLWNDESVEFHIGDNEEFIEDEELGVLFEVKFENKQVKGEVEITKVGEKLVLENNSYHYEKIKLDGVVYELHALEDIYSADGTKIYSKDELIDTYKTDSSGYFKIEDLFLGKYYLLETASSNGNVLDKTKHNFILEYKDQYTPIISLNFTYKNHLAKGRFVFSKTDLVTGDPVPNAKIQIFTKDTDTLVYEGYTDSKGMIIINDLFVGDFYLIESEAPEGYNLNPEKMEFSITEDKQIVKANMTDEKIIEVPDTSISNSKILDSIALILIISGVGYLIYDKKRK